MTQWNKPSNLRSSFRFCNVLQHGFPYSFLTRLHMEINTCCFQLDLLEVQWTQVTNTTSFHSSGENRLWRWRLDLLHTSLLSSSHSLIKTREVSTILKTREGLHGSNFLTGECQMGIQLNMGDGNFKWKTWCCFNVREGLGATCLMGTRDWILVDRFRVSGQTLSIAVAGQHLQ